MNVMGNVNKTDGGGIEIHVGTKVIEGENKIGNILKGIQEEMYIKMTG